MTDTENGHSIPSQSALVRMLPGPLRRRVERRPGLVKILDNIGWLFFDKIVRMGVGLLVGVWIARYLGPDQFGQLNYATAFVGLFAAIAGLGLNGIVVRDIVRDPESANSTLGTAFVLQVMGGLLAVILVIGAVIWLRPDDRLIQMMVAILGFSLVFKSSDIVKYWFESQVRSRYTVLVENGTLLTMAIFRVGLILSNAPLIVFAWAFLLEAALVFIGMFIIYNLRGGQFVHWQLRIERAKQLVEDGWPLLFAGISVSVYMRIDQIMLGELLGSYSVGQFAAATRISEAWYFIPMAIVASTFPSIIAAKQCNENNYKRIIQALYDYLFMISLSISLIFNYLSDSIILFLYGEEFLAAGEILKIHIWTGIFVSMGVASSSWYLSEGLQKLAFYRTLAGAIVNICANLVLIPLHGAEGSAIATLISQAAAAYLFDLLHPRTRIAFGMKSASLFPAHIFWK